MRKPGGRKRASKRNRNILIAVVVVLLVVSGGVVGERYLSPKPVDCTAVPNAARTYVAIYTSQGCFEVELFPGSAPKTVANFISLAQSGFYDDLVWHRIATSPAVIQTGDPLTRDGEGNRSLWGSGGSNKTVPLEVSNASLTNAAGYLGMARGSSDNSGTSQFYVNVKSNLDLDGQYTVFGRVIAGMSVVDKIAALPISTQYSEQPANPSQAMMLNVTVVNNP